jgi:hypothetical protein
LVILPRYEPVEARFGHGPDWEEVVETLFPQVPVEALDEADLQDRIADAVLAAQLLRAQPGLVLCLLVGRTG